MRIGLAAFLQWVLGTGSLPRCVILEPMNPDWKMAGKVNIEASSQEAAIKAFVPGEHTVTLKTPKPDTRFRYLVCHPLEPSQSQISDLS